MYRFTSVVALLCATLVACGGGGDSQSATTSDASPPETSSPVDSETSESPSASSDIGPLETEEVLIADTPSVIYLPAYAAKELGYFEEAGLDVEFIATAGGAEGTTALLSGSVNVNFGTIDAVVRLRAQDQLVKSVAGLQSQSTWKLIMDPEIIDEYTLGDVSSLAGSGLKIAVTTPGSGTDNGLRALLSANDVDPEEDVTIIYSRGIGEMVSALAQGSVDAFFTAEPGPAQATAEGFGEIFLDYGEGEVAQELFDFPIGTAIMSEEFISENPNTVAALVDAMTKAAEDVRADHQLAVDAVQARISSELSADVILGIAETDAQFWRTGISKDAVDRVLEQLVESDEVPEASDMEYEDVVATQFSGYWTPS